MSVPIDPALLVALAGGQPTPLPHYISRVELRAVGELSLTTGRVVASDPIVFCNRTFAGQAPVGRFPLRVVVGYFTHPAAEPTVAGACIEFAPVAPERWEMALFTGDDPVTLPPGHIFGYGVDSGTGCFMDQAAAEEFEILRAVSTERAYRLVRSATRSDYEWPRPYGMVELGDGHDMAVFRSGMGDGYYASYWGIFGEQPVRLVTDFRLLVV